MSETRPPRTVTPERLAELLDAYGAAPDRWPEAERDAARRLIATSAVDRDRWAAAVELDRLLDALPAEEVSPRLARRVLETAPRRSAARLLRRTLAVAVPLAAAAAVTLWLAIGRGPVRTAATARDTAVGKMAVGEYGSPTDYLLGAYGVDVYATVPSFGCADSTLGCPEVGDTEKGRQSGRRSGGSVHA